MFGRFQPIIPLRLTQSEQVFVAVRNTESFAIPVGGAVFWETGSAGGGTTTFVNEVNVGFCGTSDTAITSVNPAAFAGVVALNPLSSVSGTGSGYGVIQVYGYHPGIIVGQHGQLTRTEAQFGIPGATAAQNVLSGIFTASTNAQKSLVLKPANAIMNLQSISGGTTAGTGFTSMGVFVPMQPSPQWASQTATASTISLDYRTQIGGYAIPLGGCNLNTSSGFTTGTYTNNQTSATVMVTGTVKAFIKCL